MKKILILCVISLHILYGLAAQTQTPQDTKIIQGFNFGGGTFDTSLNTKVDRALAGDPNDPNNPSDANRSQTLVIGHSQGGLTAAGYANKAKNIYAMITVDSPIMGFAGLDSGYANLRQRVLNHINVHDRAIEGVCAAGSAIIPLGPYQVIWNSFNVNQKLSLFTQGTGMDSLINTFMSKSNPDASIQEITDMGKGSAYFKANVQDTWVEKVKVYLFTYAEPGVQWVSGIFGIMFPVPVVNYVPVYGYYDQEHPIPKINQQLVNEYQIGHVVGTDNDPIHMNISGAGDMEIAKGRIRDIYSWAGGVNLGVAPLNPFTFPYFMVMADQCFQGANWINTYKEQWGNIIGGSANDGFITQVSQTLPSTPQSRIQSVYIDHARSSPPGNEQDIATKNIAEPKTKIVWGPNGSVDQLALLMKHRYLFRNQ